jgi:hypothetical protein
MAREADRCPLCGKRDHPSRVVLGCIVIACPMAPPWWVIAETSTASYLFPSPSDSTGPQSKSESGHNPPTSSKGKEPNARKD